MPFLVLEDYHNFYLDFGATFAFCGVYFYKIKVRETLSRSHSSLNTTDNNPD
jgi:hypothetical protein